MDEDNNQKQLTQEEVGKVSRKNWENEEKFFYVLNKNSLFYNFHKEQKKKISLTLKENLRFLILHFRQIAFLFSFHFYVDSIASFEKIRC